MTDAVAGFNPHNRWAADDRQRPVSVCLRVQEAGFCRPLRGAPFSRDRYRKTVGPVSLPQCLQGEFLYHFQNSLFVLVYVYVSLRPGQIEANGSKGLEMNTDIDVTAIYFPPGGRRYLHGQGHVLSGVDVGGHGSVRTED